MQLEFRGSRIETLEPVDTKGGDTWRIIPVK